MAQGRERPLKRVVLAALGGAAVVASVFLPWIISDGVTVGTDVVSKEVLGSETEFSIAILASGAAAIVVAIVALALPHTQRIGGVLLVVAGGIAIAVAVMTVGEIRDVYKDFAITQADVPPEEQVGVRASLDALFESGVGVRPGFGLYTALAGATLAALGGIMLAIGRRRDRPDRGVTSPMPTTSERATIGASPAVQESPVVGHAPEADAQEVAQGSGAEEEAEGEPEYEPEPQRPSRRGRLGDTWSG
jgi:hypothetical protein